MAHSGHFVDTEAVQGIAYDLLHLGRRRRLRPAQGHVVAARAMAQAEAPQGAQELGPPSSAAWCLSLRRLDCLVTQVLGATVVSMRR